jgi:hypothetical protein
MAVCTHCGKEMTEQTSCSSDGYFVAGAAYPPVRWGDETPRGTWRADRPCSDCGTPRGGVHHPGCCVEQCPVCRDQVMTCNCHALLPCEMTKTTRCGVHRPKSSHR